MHGSFFTFHNSITILELRHCLRNAPFLNCKCLCLEGFNKQRIRIKFYNDNVPAPIISENKEISMNLFVDVLTGG